MRHAFLIVMCLLLATCEEPVPAEPEPITPSILSVTIDPANSSLLSGETMQFTVTVNGEGAFDSSVVWSTQKGTIDQNGLYTAPDRMGVDTVAAVSVQDPSVSGEAYAAINVTVTSVSVTPKEAQLTVGSTLQFEVSVIGEGTFDSEVTWSVNGIPGGNNTYGAITSGGLYTAPESVPGDGTIHIQAASMADPSKSDTAIVIVFASWETPDKYIGDVGTDSDGNIYVSGGFIHDDAYQTVDYFAAKFDVSGQQVWLKELDATDGPESIPLRFAMHVTDDFVYLFRYNTIGGPNFTKLGTLDGIIDWNGNQDGTRIISDASGNFYNISGDALTKHDQDGFVIGSLSLGAYSVGSIVIIQDTLFLAGYYPVVDGPGKEFLIAKCSLKPEFVGLSYIEQDEEPHPDGYNANSYIYGFKVSAQDALIYLVTHYNGLLTVFGYDATTSTRRWHTTYGNTVQDRVIETTTDSDGNLYILGWEWPSNTAQSGYWNWTRIASDGSVIYSTEVTDRPEYQFQGNGLVDDDPHIAVSLAAGVIVVSMGMDELFLFDPDTGLRIP